MQVFDDLGDKFEFVVWEQYFSDIDKDGFGVIDFEEFLVVRNKWLSFVKQYGFFLFKDGFNMEEGGGELGYFLIIED